jgi:archaellum biogenesis protein FlaJ (TadC family)
MARKIFSILIAVALGLVVFLYMVKETQSKVILITISSFIFLLISTGIHGLVAHSVNPKLKDSLLIYPLLMGLIWVILLLLFVFLVIPIMCPGFFLLNA